MFKGAAGKRSPQALGVKMKSAMNAQCVPIIGGRAQVSPKLIWKANLQTHNTSTKKGKAAKKGGDMLTYSADLDMLLGTAGFGRVTRSDFTQQGLQSVLAIWSDKDKYDVLLSSWTGVVSGGAVTIAVPGGGLLVQIIGVTVAEAYSVTLDDYGGNGADPESGTWHRNLWNSNWHYYDELSQFTHAGATRSPYTYAASAGILVSTTVPIDAGLNGKTVTVYFAYVSAFTDLPTTITAQSVEPFLGDSHATGQPIAYDDVGGIAAPSADMGAGNMAANWKYESMGWAGVSPNGDGNPADFFAQWFMGPHGLNVSGFLQATNGPATLLGSLSALRAYCDVHGIWISPYLDQQRSGSDALQDLLDIANSSNIWSEGLLKIIPLSEVSEVGNGALYTAPTAAGPVWKLQPSDFVCEQGKAPIQIKRTKQKDSKNVLPVEFTDRSNDYVVDQVDVPDGQSVSEYGARRDGTKTFHWIMDRAIARMAASPLVRRSAIQKKMSFSFTLNPRLMQIEPLDLVELNDPISGLSAYPVRITKADIDEKMNIQCEAEPFFYGANQPYSSNELETNAPGTVFTNQNPGNVSAPVIFEPIPRLYGSVGPAELWMAVAGSSTNYGGCSVWLSVDGGASYLKIGALGAKSTYGTHPGIYAAGTDPDTTHDLAVDLSISAASLSSFSAAQADQFIPLALLSYDPAIGPPAGSIIPYELLSFTTALLTSAHHYTLKATGAGNEIRRAVYGAPLPGGVGAVHGFISPLNFVYLNDPLFKIDLDPVWIGKALKFKFTAFNIFGKNEQSLALATAYDYTPIGLAAQIQAGGNGYTITPAQPLSQPVPGAYQVLMAQCQAVFGAGLTLNYNARAFGVADPGAGNTQQYWVTVLDTSLVGDTGTGTTLSAYCDNNQTKWNSAGYIRIGTIVVTHGGSVAGGGGGSSTTGLQVLTIAQAADGSRTVFSINTSVNTLMVFEEGKKINSADVAFTPGTSSFTLSYAPDSGAHLEAIGGM